MMHALNGFLNLNKGLEMDLIDEAGNIIKDIAISTDKKTLYRLTEIIVQWVLANPEPILLNEVNYIR